MYIYHSPIGLVLKNRIGAFVTAANMLSWRLRAEFNTRMKNKQFRRTAVIMTPSTRPPNIPIL